MWKKAKIDIYARKKFLWQKHKLFIGTNLDVMDDLIYTQASHPNDLDESEPWKGRAQAIMNKVWSYMALICAKLTKCGNMLLIALL